MMLISESTKVDVKGTPKVISAFVILVFGLFVLFNWILHDVKLAISQISGYLAFCTFNFKIIVLVCVFVVTLPKLTVSQIDCT